MVFAVAMSFHAGAGWSAEPVKIRMSWIAPISNWGSLLLEKKELAQHLGKSYVLEPVRYVGTPQQITALANGELEIANLAFSTLPIAIQNANLDDLRVIADEFQDGAPGYYSQEYMVLSDGPIKKIEDLKGKVVAINAAGGAVDIAIRTMLRRHGLEANRDYVIVEAPLPTMRAMLAEKKADLIPTVPPFAFDPALRSIAKPLFVNRDIHGVMQLLVLCARQSFIDKNRAAMTDFTEDMLRITRWYPRSGEPRRGRGDLRPPDQAAARAVRLAVHREGLLSRARHEAGPRRAAKKRRADEGPGLHEERHRREEIQRPQPHRGRGCAAEIDGLARWSERNGLSGRNPLRRLLEHPLCQMAGELCPSAQH